MSVRDRARASPELYMCLWFWCPETGGGAETGTDPRSTRSEGCAVCAYAFVESPPKERHTEGIGCCIAHACLARMSGHAVSVFCVRVCLWAAAAGPNVGAHPYEGQRARTLEGGAVRSAAQLQ